MAQTSVIVVSIAVLGTLAGLAYVHGNREQPAITTAEPASAPIAAAVAPPPAPATTHHEEPPARAASTREVASADVERWIADTQSNDAKTRAAAIAALASAPKARAMPALERVLESGEPQVDRQIALQSLHALALSDGDENGRIRDAIRHAMYHSDDEGVTQSAQAYLEDIEVALTEQAGSAPN